MATATQTVQRPFVRPQRNYDFLYDPNYTLSSEQDHAKESFKANTRIDRLRYVPNFKNMFSALQHYPRQSVQLDTADPVPKHVSRYWKGYANQAREALVRYKKFQYDPSVTVPSINYEQSDVEGKERYKYFRRPIIPFLPQMPPSVVLDSQMQDSKEMGESQKTLAFPATRTVHVQTDYRDSEVQTDPYSPEFVVRPGSRPELLTLANLCYGNGLPAGLAEVEMIERARAKRIWEATLPPLTDSSQMEKRRRMMEEQERREWAFRESEISALQHERMVLLRKKLQQRESKLQELNERRLEHLWNKKQRAKERQVRRIRSDHVKALRKLTEQKKHVERRREKRDIIGEYTNFDSQVYAPMTRIGVFLDAGSEQYNVQSNYNTALVGLLDLEATLPRSVMQLRTKPPAACRKNVGSKAIKQVKLGHILDNVYAELQEEKQRASEGKKPLRLLEKVEKPVPRPPTPTIEAPSEIEEQRELAIILLQRTLRGRSEENKMFASKEMRGDLIRELRTTHALQSPECKEKVSQREAILSKQRAKGRELHKEEVIADGVEKDAAEFVGRQLDFLNKELHRLQEERRIHAFAMLAERQRRMREAEESGLRQREERIRRTEDEIFKQMTRVHQGTVDSYLEDIILHSIEKTADQQSRDEIRELAEQINKTAQEFEQSRDDLQSKEMVAEMVHYFLLPEVEKQTTRQRVKHGQRRHLLAAHRIISQQVRETMGTGIEAGSTSKLTDEATPDSSTSKPPKGPVAAVGITDEQSGGPAMASFTDECPDPAVASSLDPEQSSPIP